MTIAELEKKYKDHIPTILGVTNHYAVLVPLIETAEGPSILFEVRAETLRHQPGEICFPGGRAEPNEDPITCALRETYEELGILASDIRPIAQLDMICHQSNFMMHPVLAQVDPKALAHLTPNHAEVSESFLVPLRFFEETPPLMYTYALTPKIGADFPYDRIGASEYSWRGGKVEVPIWNYGPHAIWGMTGRIVRTLTVH